MSRIRIKRLEAKQENLISRVATMNERDYQSFLLLKQHTPEHRDLDYIALTPPEFTDKITLKNVHDLEKQMRFYERQFDDSRIHLLWKEIGYPHQGDDASDVRETQRACLKTNNTYPERVCKAHSEDSKTAKGGTWQLGRFGLSLSFPSKKPSIVLKKIHTIYTMALTINAQELQNRIERHESKRKYLFTRINTLNGTRKAAYDTLVAYVKSHGTPMPPACLPVTLPVFEQRLTKANIASEEAELADIEKEFSVHRAGLLFLDLWHEANIKFTVEKSTALYFEVYDFGRKNGILEVELAKPTVQAIVRLVMERNRRLRAEHGM
ncbi:hypothetical protein BJ508DRAFT_333829 [Ascobolus immersus RN42]|uniref:Uncharacterized protein n=1 Tax=Ascobolus immersus RN42 TaxID=1160509 RepID=A0A3N4HIC6_ASCIM|nr:hypothetical protein BJ508DRAFT_333829 [Ascobolus immersus RN42]